MDNQQRLQPGLLSSLHPRQRQAIFRTHAVAKHSAAPGIEPRLQLLSGTTPPCCRPSPAYSGRSLFLELVSAGVELVVVDVEHQSAGVEVDLILRLGDLGTTRPHKC